MSAEALAAMPPAGWALAFILIAMLGCFLFGIYRLLVKKEVRLGKVEIVTPQARKAVEAASRDLFENQRANASNLLSKVWVDIYETGIRIFEIEDEKERWLLNDIAHLIDYKLQYAVHLDILRNHIQAKGEQDLRRYSHAKAEGYRRLARTFLHKYAEQLPRYPLASILDHIPPDEFKRVFEEIYFSSCSIAGKGGGGQAP